MISIVVPTYKRPELLKRAIESVFRQTYDDWELIVSDNEDEAGESWEYLQDIARSSPKISIYKNPNGSGLVSNVNNAISHAKGEWIKPLFDDDVLSPECLEVFCAAVAKHPETVLAGCLGYRYKYGKFHHIDRRPTKKPIEVVRQKDAHLALYLQEIECGGMPTQMMVHRRAIDAGAVFTETEGIVSSLDAFWFSEVLRYGDRMHIAIPLVEEYQGGHETLTSTLPENAIEEEVITLRHKIFDYIPEEQNPPSLAVIAQMVHGICGLHKIFKNKSVVNGCRSLRKVRSVEAWWLIYKWLLRIAFPGYFPVTPRIGYDFPEYEHLSKGKRKA